MSECLVLPRSDNDKELGEIKEDSVRHGNMYKGKNLGEIHDFTVSKRRY